MRKIYIFTHETGIAIVAASSALSARSYLECYDAENWRRWASARVDQVGQSPDYRGVLHIDEMTYRPILVTTPEKESA